MLTSPKRQQDRRSQVQSRRRVRQILCQELPSHHESLAVNHLTNRVFQLFQLSLLRPTVKSFDLAVADRPNKSFGVKLLIDRLLIDLGTDPADVGQVACHEQPLIFIRAKPCGVLSQLLGCIGFRID